MSVDNLGSILITYSVSYLDNLQNLNFVGFAQPEVVINTMNGNDYDGFNDRQFFVCPPDQDVHFHKLKGVPTDILSLGNLFGLIQDAWQAYDDVFTCVKEAQKLYTEFHDNSNKQKKIHPKSRSWSAQCYPKSKGQVLCLAAAVFALNEALILSQGKGGSDEAEESNIDPWKSETPVAHMKVAINLLNHLISQKLAQIYALKLQEEKKAYAIFPSMYENICSVCVFHWSLSVKFNAVLNTCIPSEKHVKLNYLEG